MAETPENSGAAGRQGDGVLLIVQDNAARRLFIAGSNDTAANMLGFARGDLDGHDLSEILGARSAEMFAEELEYVADAPDFGDVLARRRDIRLRPRVGEEVTLPCTAMRVVSTDSNARFQLVLPDERKQRAKQQLRDFLSTNLEGRQQLDPATGLPDRATTEQFLGLLGNYNAESGTGAAFAVLRLDRFDKSVARYGKAECIKLVQHVASCCRSTFRSEDVISALSDRAIGLILFDISRESARLVFNRLRWNVRNHLLTFGGKSDFSVTISVAFDMAAQKESSAIIGNCEAAIAAVEPEARNALVEIGQ